MKIKTEMVRFGVRVPATMEAHENYLLYTDQLDRAVDAYALAMEAWYGGLCDTEDEWEFDMGVDDYCDLCPDFEAFLVDAALRAMRGHEVTVEYPVLDERGEQVDVGRVTIQVEGDPNVAGRKLADAIGIGAYSVDGIWWMLRRDEDGQDYWARIDTYTPEGRPL